MTEVGFNVGGWGWVVWLVSRVCCRFSYCYVSFGCLMLRYAYLLWY